MSGLTPLECHHLALNDITLRSRARHRADLFIGALQRQLLTQRQKRPRPQLDQGKLRSSAQTCPVSPPLFVPRAAPLLASTQDLAVRAKQPLVPSGSPTEAGRGLVGTDHAQWNSHQLLR